ncbi:MAG: Crp/Fnr family transcriptional regulator [Smithellaceae bacterium]
MNSSDEFLKISRNIPFLACVPPGDLEKFRQSIIVKTFEKNQVIELEEEPSDFFYIIFSGKVKVTQVNSAGKELLLAIHRRGNYFGEMAMIDGKTAPATIVATEPSRIGFFTRKNFTTYIMNNETCLQSIVSLLCSRLRDAWITMKLHSYSDTVDRIKAALNMFYLKFGIPDDAGKIIHVKLTHKDLANYTAMSRETASRIISSLIKADEIDIIDHKYFRLKPAFFKSSPLL